MKLFIANCTKQTQVVMYRVPEHPTPRQQHIGIGQQIQIAGDLNQPQIDSIIAQLSRYGLVRADEVDGRKPFVGLTYSVEKPVKVDRQVNAIEHNDEVLTERGHEIRKNAAVAINNGLEENVAGRATLKNTEIEIEELPTKDGSGGDFSEALRVQREPQERTSPGRRARKTG
jgi:hypothetical protein